MVEKTLKICNVLQTKVGPFLLRYWNSIDVTFSNDFFRPSISSLTQQTIKERRISSRIHSGYGKDYFQLARRDFEDSLYGIGEKRPSSSQYL